MDVLASLNVRDLEPNQLSALVAVAVAAGTLYCFLGYRTIKLVIALTGFLLAGAVAATLAGWIGQGHLASMAIAGLIGGLCGAMALTLLYKTGVFFLGLLGAAVVGYIALETRTETWVPFAVLGIGIFGGLLALLVERPVVMLATSAIGAWFVVAGVVFFLFSPESLMEGRGAAAIEEYDLQIALAWLGVAICGLFAQWATLSKPASSA